MSEHHMASEDDKNRATQEFMGQKWRVSMGSFWGDKMNDDIRAKMREDRFMAAMRPITPIGNDELDRSVPTNLPVDRAVDTPYEKFRREKGLPDTAESIAEYQKHRGDLCVTDTMVAICDERRKRGDEAMKKCFGGDFEIPTSEAAEKFAADMSAVMKTAKRGSIFPIEHQTLDIKCELNQTTVSEVVRRCWSEFLEQRVTRDLVDRMALKVVAAMNDVMFPAHVTLQGLPVPGPKDYVGGLREIGLDWEQERRLIAEEARYMTEHQAKCQESTEQSDFAIKGYTGTPKSEESMLEKLWKESTEGADKLSADDKQAVLVNGWNDTTQYVKRDSFIQEFSAYETIGATIAHTRPVVVTDDPQLMEALYDAEREGRVVYDDNGCIVEIKEAEPEVTEFKRMGLEARIESQQAFAEKILPPELSGGQMVITEHRVNPDGSEYVAMVFPGLQKLPEPKADDDDDDVQPHIVEG